MAGGEYINGKPFALNVKCIVVSLTLAAAYWWLPPRSFWVVAGILWTSYVSLSWYDELYKCSDKMKPTVFPLGRMVFLPFKPPAYQEEMKNLTPEQLKVMDRVDHAAMFTILFCAMMVVLGQLKPV